MEGPHMKAETIHGAKPDNKSMLQIWPVSSWTTAMSSQCSDMSQVFEDRPL